MSFCSQTKKELCAREISDTNRMKAELYGMLLFSKNFSAGEITLNTESYSCANRYSQLIAMATGCITEVRYKNTNKKSGAILYTLSIPGSEDRIKLLEYVSHTGKEINLRINKAIVDTRELAGDFLRGAFLSCGSVASPSGEYHIEFKVPFKKLSEDLCSIIRFSGEGRAQIALEPSVVMRKGKYVVYMKDKDMLADLLAIMGAQLANMELVQHIIHKDIVNRTNRITNSEVANLKKTATASAKQISAIQTLIDSDIISALPPQLREVAYLRLNNPELSLRELGMQLSEPISRSGVNHRLEKLISIAEEKTGKTQDKMV